MLFNLEEDSGGRVTGYVVPDGFSAVPTIRVCGRGQELATFAANEKREALVQAGRHETGQCGFSIDASLVPDIAELADLELYNVESGILIYRRPRPDNIKKKLLRIETHLFPLWSVDNAIAPQFQYFAKGIENLGRETVTQLFLLNRVESVYLSGKILYRNYAFFVKSGFKLWSCFKTLTKSWPSACSSSARSGNSGPRFSACAKAPRWSRRWISLRTCRPRTKKPCVGRCGKCPRT